MISKAPHHQGETPYLQCFYTSNSIPQVSRNVIRSLPGSTMLSTNAVSLARVKFGAELRPSLDGFDEPLQLSSANQRKVDA